MRLLSLVVLFALTACGGGGGGSDNSAPQAISQPLPVSVAEVWTAEPSAVLVPSQAWEYTATSVQGSVLEPSVLYDKATSTYTMWYSGGWEKCATGTATSSDGIHWNKSLTNPLIGQGKLGQNIACRNNVVRDPVTGEVYIYFSNSTGDRPGSLYVTHSADGVTNLATPQLFLSPGVVDLNLANSWVTVEGGIWHFFYDSITPSGAWEAFAATCSSPLGPCTKNPGPLKGLQIGIGSYGGGWVQMQDGRFNTYYLAGPNGSSAGHVPTYLYHACDAAMGTVAFGNHGNPILPLPSGYDQLGDPFLIDGATLPDGNSRIWYDQVNNPTGFGHIVTATLPGALSGQCN